MKFKNILKLGLFFVTFISSIAISYAAEMDHFEIKLAPETAKVGESIDVSLKAVDKNGELVEDYKGTVLIFSYSDTDMKIPKSLENNSYEFTASDQGEIKFENGFSFTKKGLNDISIFDLNSSDDEVLGEAKIEITEDDEDKAIKIDILSPEGGLTIPNKKVKVSGSTNKNHRVKILVNGKENETTSNSNGIYELEVFDLKAGENTIKTQVLDADEKVVGESKEVSIKVEDGNVMFKNIKLIPEEVFTEAIYEIEVAATPKLSEVSILVNDELVKLEEKKDGIYIGKTYAPTEKGTYKLDITLKGELGQEMKELGITELTVNELPAAKEEPKEKPDTKVKPKPKEEVKAKVCETQNLDITGLKLTELKTKSILTWKGVKNAKSYNIYKKNSEGKFELVTSVSKPKFEVLIDTTAKKETYENFAVKAICMEDGEIYEGNLSEATKVKTGPEMLIFLILSLFLGGLFFMFNFKK